MLMRLTRTITSVAMTAGLMGFAMVPVAPQADRNTPGVAGRWTMSVRGTPHGDMTMALVLKQEATKVTGTFASPHGDMPVEGEFIDNMLALATVGGESQITFKATLKDNGTLSGFLSSAMGDMTWTAERTQGGQ